MSKTKSSGPRSLTGKEIASMNAFKHGLSAQKWISPELDDYFHQILKGLSNEYLPQTPTEILLVERVANTITKIRRLNIIEDAQYQLAKEKVIEHQQFTSFVSPSMRRLTDGEAPRDADLRKLEQVASMPNAEVMSIINRQQNSLSRQVSKEISELISLIERRKNLKASNGEVNEIAMKK